MGGMRRFGCWRARGERGRRVKHGLIAEVPTEPLPLTERQKEVFDLVSTYCRAVDDPCPWSYVSRHLGITREGVRGHIEALWKKGWIRSPGSPVRPR